MEERDLKVWVLLRVQDKALMVCAGKYRTEEDAKREARYMMRLYPESEYVPVECVNNVFFGRTSEDTGGPNGEPRESDTIEGFRGREEDF